MPRIFISYRREETAYPAAWLYDRLAERFDEAQIFKDVDSIEPGEDFVERITRAVGSCDVLLALIGDRWLTIQDEEGKRRLDRPDDFVRIEIEAALARGVRVIPVLVDGAQMPDDDELPPSLAPLARRQALELSPQRFEFDTSRLLETLESIAAGPEEPRRRRGSLVRASRRAWIAAGLAIAAVLVVAALAVAVVRTSSGGGETAADRNDSWLAEVNQICERANESIDDLPEPSSANVAALDIDAVLAYGEASVNINKRMVRDLGEVSAPADAQPGLRALVLRGAAATEAAEELFAAMRVGDIVSAQQHQGALSDAGKAFDAKALELGATTCAEGASLSGVTAPGG